MPKMQIHVKHDEIILLMLDYLKRHNCIESMRSLEKETNLALDTYGRELDFLRALVLDGQWDDAEGFINPLKGRACFDHAKVLFEFRKQRFLELLDSQALSPAVVQLVEHLKSLEDQCSKSEFNRLCYCLTLKNLTDHPDYRFWTPYKGRMQCFERIQTAFDQIYPQDWIKRHRAVSLEPDRLVEMLKQSILYQLSLAASSNPSLRLPPSQTFSILQDIGEAGLMFPVETAATTHHPSPPIWPSPTVTHSPPVAGADVDSIPDEETNHPVAWSVPGEEANSIAAGDAADSRQFRPIAELKDLQPVRSVAFSATGDRLAIGSNTRCIRVCSTETSTINDCHLNVLLEYPEHHLGSIYCLDWSSDERFIASGSNDTTVKVTPTATPASSSGSSHAFNPIVFRGHTGTVRDVAFRRLTSQLASAGAGDNIIRVWDIEGGAGASNRPTLSLPGHVRPVFSLSVSFDGDSLFSASSDASLRMWDLRTGQTVCTMGDHAAALSSVAVDVQCRNVYAGYADGSCAAWDLAAGGKELWRISHHSEDCRSVSVSPDGQLLLTGSFDSSSCVLDARYGDMLERYRQHSNKVVQVQWHPALAQFVSCSADRTVKLWGCPS